MENIRRLEVEVSGEIWVNSEAYRNLLALCDEHGSRFAGTEGEKLAVEYLVGKFRDYGLDNVAADPYTYTGWERGPARLDLLEPMGRELPAISLPLSPPGDVEGEIHRPWKWGPLRVQEEGDRDRGQDRPMHQRSRPLRKGGSQED
jgi:hypothetical protein